MEKEDDSYVYLDVTSMGYNPIPFTHNSEETLLQDKLLVIQLQLPLSIRHDTSLLLKPMYKLMYSFG